MSTVNLTVAQAVVKFLGAQYSESDGVEQKLFAGCFGIFGHGNVAGLGQALLQAELEDPELLPYILGRNEQAMVHTAVAYARMKNRLQTYAVVQQCRPGRHQHGHRRGAGHHQPAAGAAAAGRHVCRPECVPAAAGARAGLRRRRHGQRRVPAGVEVLRPDLAARAAAGRAARRDAGADRPGRDRGGDVVLPAGRPGPGVRLADRAVRAAGSGTSRARCRSGRSSKRRPR